MTTTKLTPSEMQKYIDLHCSAFEKSMNWLMDRAHEEYVVPFCDKTGYRFNPGMDTWSFDHATKPTIYSVDVDAKLPARLLKVLTIEHPLYRQDIGALMEAYVPEREKR